MACTLTGGKRRKKATLFKHTRAFISGMGSDLRGKRLFPRTRRYVGAVSGDVARLGKHWFKRARSMRRRTLGFR